jgi:hypothetical protein
MRATRLCCFLFLVSLTLILMLMGCSKSTQPEPLVNRLYLPEQLETSGGSHFSVPIRFDNEVELTAVSVPLFFPSSIMRFDSLSFHGSRVSQFDFKSVYVLGDTILIGVLGATDDIVSVNRGRGLLATIHFRIYGNAPETTFVLNTFDSWKQPLSFFDINLERLPTPLFNPCQVHVKTIVPPD